MGEEERQEVVVDDQAEPEAPKRRRRAKPKEPDKPVAPGLMDEVQVRFHGEMGIVAGQVVRDGFLVTCLYHQYLTALETSTAEHYELVR